MIVDIYDQILENLELERELGTRTVEIDRALLVPPPVAPVPEPEPVHADSPKQEMPLAASAKQKPTPAPATDIGDCDIAFFTGKPLSKAGGEAMQKIFAAIKQIDANIAVAMNEDRAAKVVVLLGSDALRKKLPTARPMRGNWVELGGVPAMMTFSPDYIFTHFQVGSPKMLEAKKLMWHDIKSAVSRLGSLKGMEA